jgi:hypothetical protein
MSGITMSSNGSGVASPSMYRTPISSPWQFMARHQKLQPSLLYTSQRQCQRACRLACQRASVPACQRASVPGGPRGPARCSEAR